MSSIKRRLQGKNILLTGATGFLAKVILEKILRSIPDSGKIFVLIRSRGQSSAEERLQRDVFGSTVFDRLREDHPGGFADNVSSRVTAIDGDLSAERLALSEDTYSALARDTDIVIGSAAVCTFREQLDRQMQVNTLGVRRVLEFARDSGNVPLVHVSTCFVTGRNEGRILEQVLPLGRTARTEMVGIPRDFDIDEEISAMLATCSGLRDVNPGEAGNRAVARFGLEAAIEHGWWDAYPFTKALGEQLVARDRGDVPVAIVRPSIIESSFREPTPGWIDGVRMLDPLFTEGGKGYLREFPGDPATVIDLVPCDMVASAVLAAVPESGVPGLAVYQVCSSDENPVTVGEMAAAGLEAFRKRPSRNRDGKPVVPKPLQFLSTAAFQKRMNRRARLLAGIRTVSRWMGMDARARWANMMMRLLARLAAMADMYSHYVFSSPTFDSTNTRRLRLSLSQEDREEFFFDPAAINWREYLVDTHVPALQLLTGDGDWYEPAALDITDTSTSSSEDERRQISA